ncbi:DUF6879 family protein [Streptomyces sp. NBC_00648]|uniref:DUF6879 family protein n=1 Tax=Streptomyces sp. NBC_00648 TaxID=2975797 RepID=UPI003249AD0F
MICFKNIRRWAQRSLTASIRNLHNQRRRRLPHPLRGPGPPTEGQRFLLASGLGNVRAGEDIRNLPRSKAERLGLPDYDFWLFDSRVLARFVFDEDDTTVGVILSEDPAEIAAACQARDAAWHHAIRTTDFARKVRSGA